MEEQLKELKASLDRTNEKLEAIEKKTSEKWVIPVVLLVLTTVFGVISYAIEKRVDTNVVAEQTKNEIIATFKAESQRDFYKDAQLKLNDLQEKFEALCLFNDQSARLEFGTTLNTFDTFCNQPNFVDKSIINALNTYALHVATVFGNSQPGNAMDHNDSIAQARAYYQEALNAIEEGLNAL